MKNKVVRLEALRQDFKASPSVEVTEIHAGFSRRMNFFIDSSDIETPSLDEGRISFVAEMLDASRPAVTDWLSKNKPPKETKLFEVVKYYLRHIEGGEDILPARVVSWLRYGSEVCLCPFGILPEESLNQKYIPLAANIIATEAKAMGLEASSYDLTPVLDSTIQTLVDFELSDSDQVQDVHRIIIQQYIKNNSR